MPFPRFITNTKTYEIGFGEAFQELLGLHKALQKETNIPLSIAANPLELGRWSLESPEWMWAQHCDGVDFGSHTGRIHPYALRKMKVAGTLLNHSEYRLSHSVIESTLEALWKEDLRVVLCAESLEEIKDFITLYKKISSHFPKSSDLFAIAYEPPELIGDPHKSVSSENPEIIQKAQKITGSLPLFVGAGINTPQDISTALELGAYGFLVASGICKSDDPQAKLKSLIQAIQASPTRFES